ncbi:enzyme E2 [Moumouvirus goulette]|uniref:E2 ubiquitin-conjugating enzyme n=1 Tax=Moumouvirus goulette TaxID=1247379 RepID=M1PHK3_9VIRU|nr:enzyme E2 [Moumouvirus goulette]AGF85563.1 enzyme E2 [Moumouvirus goulette]
MLTVNKRVLKDINDGMKNLKKEFGIYIAPEENDYYKVHFILPGPEDTPFEGGLYHGMIRLNNDHPLRAPNIHMITPNGRFMVEKYPISPTSRGICTTATSFHPESWTPMNNIESVLKGFISLMCDPFDNGIGAINSTPLQIKKMAQESINHLKSDPVVKNLFHELYDQITSGKYVPINLSKLISENKNQSTIKSSTTKSSTIKSSTTKSSTTKSSTTKSSDKNKIIKKESSEEDTSEEELLEESSEEESSEEESSEEESSEDTSEEELLESSEESSDENTKKKSCRKIIKKNKTNTKIPKNSKRKNIKKNSKK